MIKYVIILSILLVGCTSCPTQSNPVCAADSQTYKNACEAELAGQKVIHIGECQFFCTAQWDPVCGNDNMTYSNECEARDIGVAYDGEC